MSRTAVCSDSVGVHITHQRFLDQGAGAGLGLRLPVCF